MRLDSLKLNKDEHEVEIKSNKVLLSGILGLPAKAKGLVIFAHGSGSSRFSLRNNFVARELHKTGMATLLMDLLTEQEELNRHNVFDIELLASRLLIAKKWLGQQTGLANFPLAYFGASTGAGAALYAAALDPENIFAVVSRGGRPDLAAEKLRLVQAPTLFIVGGRDTLVLDLNREALANLPCTKKMEIVPGATHLFEEPGALEQVAKLATKWYASAIIAPSFRTRSHSLTREI